MPVHHTPHLPTHNSHTQPPTPHVCTYLGPRRWHSSPSSYSSVSRPSVLPLGLLMGKKEWPMVGGVSGHQKRSQDRQRASRSGHLSVADCDWNDPLKRDHLMRGRTQLLWSPGDCRTHPERRCDCHGNHQQIEGCIWFCLLAVVACDGECASKRRG